MRCFAAFIFLSSALAFAAAPEPPVSQTEAASVFTKAEHVLTEVLHYRVGAPSFPGGAGVATREQILKHFAALLAALQPKFKFMPPRLHSVPAIITLKDKQTAEKLEVLGLIDRYGPLVSAKASGLSPHEFGDALGLFMSRVAELTHTPTTKFSPYLWPT